MRAKGTVVIDAPLIALTGVTSANAETGQPLDSFMAGYDHGADPAPRTVPAP